MTRAGTLGTAAMKKFPQHAILRSPRRKTPPFGNKEPGDW